MSSNSPCRVCSQEKSVNQMVDVFEAIGHRDRIAEVITELTGLKVKENDGLPSLCCMQCHSDLTISITIRRKCIYSDTIMRALLQSAFGKTEAHGPVDHIKLEDSEVEPIAHENDELIQSPETSFEMDGYKLNITPQTAQNINERMVTDDGYIEFGFDKTHISNSPTENPGDSLDGTEEQALASTKFENNQCSICKTYFVDFSALQEHAANCHNDESVNRNRQDDSTSKSGEFYFVGLPPTRLVKVSKKIAIAPEPLNHDEVMGCCMCRRTFRSEAELMEHGKLVHAPKSAPTSECKPFLCNICYTWFKTESDMRSHQVRNRKRPYKCPTCGMVFKTRSDFLRHKNKHDKALIFPCKYCTKRFVSLYKRLGHEKKCSNQEQRKETICKNQEQTQDNIGKNQEQTQEKIDENREQTQEQTKEINCKNQEQTQEAKCEIPEQSETPVHTPKPRYRYPIADNEIIDPKSVNHVCCGCGTTFDTEVAMMKHANRVHAPKARLAETSNPFKCNICCQTYKTDNDLSNHKIKMLPKRYKCATCGAQFDMPFSLVRHKAKHSNVPTLPCTFCGKLFVSFYNKMKHQQSEHILEIQSKCCGCCADFGTNNELLQHAQTVHAPKAVVDLTKPFRCNICYKSFKTEMNLRHHQVVQGRFQCAICGKIFSARASLITHERIHNTKEYECGQCGQTFHNKYAKEKHTRLTHKELENFVCPTCGKTYTTANYLRDHMSLHQDKPLHKCFCGAEFKMKPYLYSHMIVAHSGRHTCRFCQATFRCASLLKGHENGHLGLKEYVCSVCNKGFHSQKQLGKHVGKWHGTKSHMKKRKKANKS